MINFTILLPTYNIENYIEICINSIINQTYKNWKCIILDDNSTDNTYQKILNIVNNDKRFFIYKNKVNTKFAANNRNILLSKVTDDTDYILFMDHDDHINLNLLEKLNNILLKKQYDIILFNHYISLNKCDLKNSEKFELLTTKANKEGEYTAYNPPTPIWVWDKIIKYSIIKDNNLKFFNNCMSEDSAFVLLLYNYVKTIYHTGTYEYYHRILSTSHGRIGEYKKLPLSISCYALLLVYFKTHNLTIGLETVKRRYNMFLNKLNNLLEI